MAAFAPPVQSTGAWDLRDEPGGSMSSVHRPAPFKNFKTKLLSRSTGVARVPERFRAAANTIGASAAPPPPFLYLGLRTNNEARPVHREADGMQASDGNRSKADV